MFLSIMYYTLFCDTLKIKLNYDYWKQYQVIDHDVVCSIDSGYFCLVSVHI